MKGVKITIATMQPKKNIDTMHPITVRPNNHVG